MIFAAQYVKPGFEVPHSRFEGFIATRSGMDGLHQAGFLRWREIQCLEFVVERRKLVPQTELACCLSLLLVLYTITKLLGALHAQFLRLLWR